MGKVSGLLESVFYCQWWGEPSDNKQVNSVRLENDSCSEENKTGKEKLGGLPSSSCHPLQQVSAQVQTQTGWHWLSAADTVQSPRLTWASAGQHSALYELCLSQAAVPSVSRSNNGISPFIHSSWKPQSFNHFHFHLPSHTHTHTNYILWLWPQECLINPSTYFHTLSSS